MAKANSSKADTGNQDKLKSYLEAYPHEKTFYISTDGQVFLSKNKKEAETHQKFIDNEETLSTVNVD
jgi:hypothetical protein